MMNNSAIGASIASWPFVFFALLACSTVACIVNEAWNLGKNESLRGSRYYQTTFWVLASATLTMSLILAAIKFVN
jgi:hypothetical protein